MARRYVQDGILPPKDAIRAEEFVTTSTTTPLPDEGQTFAVHLEGSPSPFGQTDRYEIVRIGIQGLRYSAGGAARCGADLRDRRVRADGP